MESGMALPAPLLTAVSTPGGGKLALIVGCGCSYEAPTSIPLAGTCSQESHDRLVANNVIGDKDCSVPWDLSALADAVVNKTKSQAPLVDQLSQHYPFKDATPNDGHLLAAAMLREGVVSTVLTLNFDLAFTTAIAALGVGHDIGIIDGPSDFGKQKTSNVYYLHRNVNAANPEDWVLRTIALQTEWKNGWEKVVAGRVLSTPVVLFAGLGSPAAVLTESTKLIQTAIPAGIKAYQVDPGDMSKCQFAKDLGIDPANYIKMGWCDFMLALSARVVDDHTTRLSITAAAMVKREGWSPEDLKSLVDRIKAAGLLLLGRMRSTWLLHEKPYYPDEDATRELIADLLLASATIERVSGASPVLFEDGVIEFRRGDRTVSACLCVSGRGTRSRIAIESELSKRHRHYRSRGTPLTGAIVAGLSPAPSPPVTPPTSVIAGNPTNSILMGTATLPLYDVASIRTDAAQPKRVAP